MVRWPSGVTRMKQRPVVGPLVAWATGKSTPAACTPSAKRSPSLSFFTRPMNEAEQPKLAAPITVFAAEPPATVTVAPIASSNISAGVSSMSVIAPLAMR